MDPEKKTTFGATIEPTSTPLPPSTPLPAAMETPQTTPLHQKTSRDINLSSSPHSGVSTPSHAQDASNPFSPFYEHRPSTAHSTLQPPPVYYHDVESQGQLSATKSTISRTQECSMWPSRDALKAKALEEKKKRSWNPLTRLNKRQKLAAQILIALIIVGAAVGIGVGVSRAVGGGVWSGNGQSKQIPNDKKGGDKSS